MKRNCRCECSKSHKNDDGALYIISVVENKQWPLLKIFLILGFAS